MLLLYCGSSSGGISGSRSTSNNNSGSGSSCCLPRRSPPSLALPSVGCLVSTARGPAAIKRRKKKCEGKRDRKIRSNRKQHVGKKNKIR
jgi:hypothetical protein